MFSLFLTQSGGFLGTIAKPFGWILNAIYEFLSFAGIENVALSLILFTFITKALMIPLTIKQQKFSKMTSIMQPELNAIQKKYNGKKDQASMQKMQLETQAVYEKYGASPTAGCLPMLITFPILFALYKVVQNIPAYVPSVKALYETVANNVIASGNYVDTMTDMAKTAGVVTNQFSEIAASNSITVNHMIDIMSKFNTSQWKELVQAFPSVTQASVDQIIHVNRIVGSLNIANAPGWGFPGIIIPILAVVTQWGQTKLMQPPKQDGDQNSTAAAMNSVTNSMTTIMPLFSGFMCTMLPTGLGIYWVANAVFGIIQQFFVNRYMDKLDVNEMVQKSKEKADNRRAKINGVTGSEVKQAASTNTKNIAKSTANYAKMNTSKDVNTTSKKSEVSYKTGSIAQNANLLKNRYNDKGEK